MGRGYGCTKYPTTRLRLPHVPFFHPSYRHLLFMLDREAISTSSLVVASLVSAFMVAGGAVLGISPLRSLAMRWAIQHSFLILVVPQVYQMCGVLGWLVCQCLQAVVAGVGGCGCELGGCERRTFTPHVAVCV